MNSKKRDTERIRLQSVIIYEIKKFKIGIKVKKNKDK